MSDCIIDSCSDSHKPLARKLPEGEAAPGTARRVDYFRLLLPGFLSGLTKDCPPSPPCMFFTIPLYAGVGLGIIAGVCVCTRSFTFYFINKPLVLFC